MLATGGDLHRHEKDSGPARTSRRHEGGGLAAHAAVTAAAGALLPPASTPRLQIAFRDAWSAVQRVRHRHPPFGACRLHAPAHNTATGSPASSAQLDEYLLEGVMLPLGDRRIAEDELEVSDRTGLR